MKGRARKARRRARTAECWMLKERGRIRYTAGGWDLEREVRKTIAAAKLAGMAAPGARPAYVRIVEVLPPRSRGGSKRKRAAAGGKEAK